MRAGGLARRLLAAGLAGLCTLAAAQDCAAPLEITQARRTIAGAGAPWDGTREVLLPDELPAAARGEGSRIRYELDVGACAGQPAAALWLFRVGAPYRLEAQGEPLPLLNARALLSPGRVVEAIPLSLEDVHNGRVPGLFALPGGARRVTVELQTLPYFPAGLVRVQAGPVQELLPVQAQAAEVAVAYVDTASVVLAVVCAIALLLWSSRRADRGLFWLGITCGLWGWRGLAYFSHRVYLEPLLFEQLNSLNIAVSAAALATAILHMLDRPGRWERRILLGNVLLCAGGFVAAEAAGQGARAVRALCLLSSFGLMFWVLARAWRAPRHGIGRQRFILLSGIGVLIACGAHDLALLGGALPADRPSFIFWGFVALLLAIAFLSAQYVVLTLNRAERSNEELELHVLRKTSELEESYSRLREREQETVRTHERERLLRDMHDGLGAQLMTALRGIERGALGPQQVTQSLQDSLDELRLLMDSADMGHYLPGALAAWRNRWDHRLAAAGVALVWRIDESLDEAQLPGDAALQVMRILQEAATNIVKHAQAQTMVLDARAEGAGGARELRIAISDDGRGMPDEPGRAGARGLKNMRHRAAQIGGRLTVGTGMGGAGTCVELRLPLAAGGDA